MEKNNNIKDLFKGKVHYDNTDGSIRDEENFWIAYCSPELESHICDAINKMLERLDYSNLSMGEREMEDMKNAVDAIPTLDLGNAEKPSDKEKEVDEPAICKDCGTTLIGREIWTHGCDTYKPPHPTMSKHVTGFKTEQNLSSTELDDLAKEIFVHKCNNSNYGNKEAARYSYDAAQAFIDYENKIKPTTETSCRHEWEKNTCKKCGQMQYSTYPC